MFGKNIVVKAQSREAYLKDTKIGIVEIFSTLQGEGPFSGVPAVFIRTKDCSLRCHFCMDENQKIIMGDNHYKKIKDIQVGDIILGLNKTNCRLPKISQTEVLEVHDNGIKPLIKIEFDDGSALKCTPDHKLYLHNGYKNVWVQAARAKIGFEAKRIGYAKNENDISSDFKKGWLSGYIAGDGNIQTVTKPKSGNNYTRIKCTSNDADILERAKKWSSEFDMEFREVLHAHGPSAFNTSKAIIKNGKSYIPALECTKHNETINFLETIEYRTDDLEDMSDEYILGWLGGMYDAEGTLDGSSCRISQSHNTHIGIVNSLRYALTNFRFTYSEQKSNKSGMTSFVVSGQQMFLSMINPVCFRKIATSFSFQGKSEKKSIVKINTIEKNRVFDLTTTSHNYICEGIICHNCDTEFSKGINMETDDIIAKTKALLLKNAYGPPLVVITGGEPLIWQGIKDLIDGLFIELECAIQLETSGSVYPVELPWMNPNFHLVCSPKTAKLNKNIEMNADAFKYIITAGEVSEDDGLPNMSTQIKGKPQMIARPPAETQIFVTPCDPHSDDDQYKKNTDEAINSCLKFGYTMNLQLHKIVGLP